MTLVCYLDDSGNKDEPIVTLAGYIARAPNWLDFEVDARALFDAWELPYLHTVDLHHRRKEFKGWTREQTAEFANAFYKPAFPKYRRYSVRREGDSAIRIMKL